MIEPTNQDQINEAEWQKKSNWKASLFYYSEVDSRLWVPKRSMLGRRRYGGTPNFAKKGARLYLMVVLGLMALLLTLVVTLERAGILN